MPSSDDQASSLGKIIGEGVKVGHVVTVEMRKIWEELGKWNIWQGNNSFRKGFITEGDKLIYSDEFRHAETGRIGDVEEYTVDFNQKCTHVQFEKITAIIYKDHWVDGTGAKGEILGGGVNHNYLKFRVTPKYLMGTFPRGCHSKLLIYGK